MRLFDADALRAVLIPLEQKYAGAYADLGAAVGCIVQQIDRFPAVDAVIVTRCKDCRYLGRELDKGLYSCDDYNLPYCEPDSYCSHGRRKEETKHAAD